MIPYFLLLLVFAIPALSEKSCYSLSSFKSFVFFSLLSIFVGLRYFTGGDWWNYFTDVQRAYGVPFDRVFELSSYEPFYAILNWLGSNVFGGLVFVNFICAVIFTFSLVLFCKSQPRPMLALTLSIPYLVIVVAMGYTRQSVAIGFEMLALLALQKRQSISYILFILVGALFHAPVLVLMIVLVFSNGVLPASIPSSYQRLIKLFLLILAAVGFYSTYSVDLNTFVQGYQSDYSDYSPQGAFIRVSLTSLYALVFLSSRNKFLLSSDVRQIWSGLSAVSLISLLLLIIGVLPTAVDRLALYLLPLQVFVGSRLPNTNLLGLSPNNIKVLLIFFCFSFLFVWFNFANNSGSWLPYENLLI